MIAKVKDYVKKQHMILPQDIIVAGISGGVDSVCLLFLLLEIKKEIPFTLLAVHVNHHLREEAGRDAAFVKELCKKWGCEYACVDADVKEYAAQNRLSSEEAGRILRYEAFEKALANLGCKKESKTGKIAVAHNKNDNAETVLFHLFRGTGISGLAGIRPVREKVIRPLLCAERWEIETFIKERGLSFCIDGTNEEDTYTRNRIRHTILPFAEQEICRGAVSHIYDTSVIMREAQEYIQNNARHALQSCTCQKTENSRELNVIRFLENPSFLQKQMLMLCLEELTESRKDIGSVHILDIQKLFLRKGNRCIDLPGRIMACREYETVRIKKHRQEKNKVCRGAEDEKERKILEIKGPGKYQVKGLGTVEICVFPCQKPEIIPQKAYTKWFDYDKIVKSLVIRGRKAGDYLTINNRMNKKTLKDYLIQEKIPKEKREEIFVLSEENHVLWVIGGRISEYYKVEEGTKTILQVQITGGI